MGERMHFTLYSAKTMMIMFDDKINQGESETLASSVTTALVYIVAVAMYLPAVTRLYAGLVCPFERYDAY